MERAPDNTIHLAIHDTNDDLVTWTKTNTSTSCTYENTISTDLERDTNHNHEVFALFPMPEARAILVWSNDNTAKLEYGRYHDGACVIFNRSPGFINLPPVLESGKNQRGRLQAGGPVCGLPNDVASHISWAPFITARPGPHSMTSARSGQPHLRQITSCATATSTRPLRRLTVTSSSWPQIRPTRISATTGRTTGPPGAGQPASRFPISASGTHQVGEACLKPEREFQRDRPDRGSGRRRLQKRPWPRYGTAAPGATSSSSVTISRDHRSGSHCRGVHAGRQQRGQGPVRLGRDLHHLWTGLERLRLGHCPVRSLFQSTDPIEWLRLAADPASDDLMLGFEDSTAYLYALKWTGAAWDTSATAISSTALTRDDEYNRPFDVIWESGYGHTGHAIIAYSLGATVKYKHYDGSSWGSDEGYCVQWQRLMPGSSLPEQPTTRFTWQPTRLMTALPICDLHLGQLCGTDYAWTYKNQSYSSIPLE